MTQPTRPPAVPRRTGVITPNQQDHRDRIFTLIAHDLRNMLQPLRGYSTLLLRELRSDEMSLAEINDLAQGIYRVNEAVLALLETMLAWALRADRFTPEPIGLRLIAEATIDLLAQPAAAKQITVRQTIPPELTIYGDSNILAAVLRNLLGNAIKFTQTGGQVCLAAVEASTPGWVQITVTDTGVGLDDQMALFTCGVPHLQPGAAGEHGSGLGLLLCREMVEQHGGQLWLETNPAGRGTRVRFTLPRFDAAGRPPPLTNGV